MRSKKVSFYDCYNYNEDWFLVEMALNVRPSEIRWEKFTVPERGKKKSDWQVPYMEQYLNPDGTEKVCETYEEPEADEPPCRVVFFIFKHAPRILRTPYGKFPLADKELPERLRSLVEFEEVD